MSLAHTVITALLFSSDLGGGGLGGRGFASVVPRPRPPPRPNPNWFVHEVGCFRSNVSRQFSPSRRDATVDSECRCGTCVVARPGKYFLKLALFLGDFWDLFPLPLYRIA